MMRVALDLACEFYGSPNLRISDVRWTKLIDFENGSSRFRVNMRLYEPVAHSVWKLVFGQVQHGRSFPNVDIGLFEGHCFYIKNLNKLANHWECVGCKQSHHDNHNRDVTKKQCTGSQPKLACDGGKFKHIMSSSEKVFYGGNMQLSWKACRWIVHQSELTCRHIHHGLCGHGGERCVVIDKKEILVDEYDPETSAIYQFYGCKCHSCPCSGPANDKYRDTLSMEK